MFSVYGLLKPRTLPLKRNISVNCALMIPSLLVQPARPKQTISSGVNILSSTAFHLFIASFADYRTTGHSFCRRAGFSFPTHLLSSLESTGLVPPCGESYMTPAQRRCKEAPLTFRMKETRWWKRGIGTQVIRSDCFFTSYQWRKGFHSFYLLSVNIFLFKYS